MTCLVLLPIVFYTATASMEFLFSRYESNPAKPSYGMINGMRFSIKGVAKTGLGLTGLVIWILSSFILWLMWLITWVDWLGAFGILIAIFATPGLVIFPFIYWIVENTFPFEYFLLWGIGIFGLVLAAAVDR